MVNSPETNANNPESRIESGVETTRNVDQILENIRRENERKLSGMDWLNIVIASGAGISGISELLLGNYELAAVSGVAVAAEIGLMIYNRKQRKKIERDGVSPDNDPEEGLKNFSEIEI